MPISLQVFLLLLVLFQVPTRTSTFEINSNRNNRSIHHNKKTNSRRRRRRRRTSPSSALSVLSSSALSSSTSTSMTTTTSTNRKHLILVGGGHAHVQVIKALNTASRPANVDVTLIDLQQSASYSGMVVSCCSSYLLCWCI